MRRILNRLEENNKTQTKLESKLESKQQPIISYKVTYNQDNRLGKGGCAEVYKGKLFLTQNKTQEVAVKILSFDQNQKGKTKEEQDLINKNNTLCFENEMQIFKTLRSMPSSPNIVQSYEAAEVLEEKEVQEGEYSSVPIKHAIVMEYAPSGSLIDFIYADGSLTPAGCYDVVSGIANGIDFLHENRIIHRDIKPENVLLSDGGQPKICDFGFAVQEEKNDSRYCGTTSYIAPEIIQGKKYTKAVDVFSFGMTLFEIVVGETPFYGHKSSDIVQAIASRRRPKIPEACPEKLKNLIMACWQQDPALRPTIKKVVQCIQDIGGDEKEILGCEAFTPSMRL